MDPDFRYEQLCRDEERKRLELYSWIIALIIGLPIAIVLAVLS